MTKKFALLCLLTMTLLTAGCPDYSHLRPVPDYSNMRDGGAESESENAEVDEPEAAKL